MSDLYDVFEVELSEDLLTALIKVSAPIPDTVTADDLTAFLKENSVV